MTKTLYKLAFLIAFVALLLLVISGKTLYTSIVRSAAVYIGVLLAVFVIGKFIRLGMAITVRWQSGRNIN
ncbi:MAG: hypothetical protein ABIA75_01630 [Candidatus Neomarinimicrobiota bacterium]